MHSEIGAIKLTLLPREGGGLRVYSSTHPGLILSGADPQKVMESVWPALTALKDYEAKKS